MDLASRINSTVVLCFDTAQKCLLKRRTVRSYYSFARYVPLAPAVPKAILSASERWLDPARSKL